MFISLYQLLYVSDAQSRLFGNDDVVSVYSPTTNF